MQKDTKWLLLVEDEAELRELVCNFLEIQLPERVKLVAVPDGAEATAKVRYQAYDCIITDLRMPKKEGRAFVETVHQSPLNEKTPIILFTGYPDQELMDRFPNCNLLEKPAPPDKVLERIETQLKLGPMDRRLGAHMLNCIIECAKLLSGKLVGCEAVLEAPRLKRPGEKVAATYVRYVTWKSARETYSFAFTFTPELLVEMDKKLFKGASTHSPGNVALAASNTILKNVAKMMKVQTGVVTKSVMVSPENPTSPPELIAAKGIVMPLFTPFGSLEVLALC